MPLSPSIQARLLHQHETLHELTRGLTEVQLKERIQPDKWSAFENIVHLTAYQPLFFKRMERMERTDSPLFERYVADDDPLFHQYLERPLPALQEDYATQRFLINNRLMQLSESMLRRQGIHPVYGCFSMGQWADFFLLHEAHHLFTIFMLTAALRKRFQ